MNNCFRDVDAKVLAERNIVDVHEDRILAITVGEAIPNAARHHLGIGTPVGDRDLRKWALGKAVRAEGNTQTTKSLDLSDTVAMRSFDIANWRRHLHALNRLDLGTRFDTSDSHVQIRQQSSCSHPVRACLCGYRHRSRNYTTG